MNEKENASINKEETKSQKKQSPRYTGENKKVTAKLNEQQTGPRKSRGKKQRRQFKLAPNRG